MKTWWLRGHTKEYSQIHEATKELSEHKSTNIPARLPPLQDPPTQAFDIPGNVLFYTPYSLTV